MVVLICCHERKTTTKPLAGQFVFVRRVTVKLPGYGVEKAENSRVMALEKLEIPELWR